MRISRVAIDMEWTWTRSKDGQEWKCGRFTILRVYAPHVPFLPGRGNYLLYKGKKAIPGPVQGAWEKFGDAQTEAERLLKEEAGS